MSWALLSHALALPVNSTCVVAFVEASTSSDEAKLIGIIVGVVAACALLLLVLFCCWFRQRRAARAAAKPADAAPAVEGKQDSVYMQGIKVKANGSFDQAAVDSPEHVHKMKKLAAMQFRGTNSPKVQAGTGAVPYSPEAQKGFAFPNVTVPSNEAFGSPLSAHSPVYTPGGTNIISKLFSPHAGTQVSD